MYTVKLRKKSKSELCEYIIASCFILNMRSIWTALPSMEWFGNLLTCILVVSVVLLFFVKKNLYFNLHKSLIMTIGVAIYLGLFYLLDSLKYNSLILFIINVAVIVFLNFIVDNIGTIFKKIEDLMLLLTIISLFFWIFGSYLNIIEPTGTVYTSWTGSALLKKVYSYYGLYFETQSINFLGLLKVVRNTAIFTEAPMASYMFSMGLLIELFWKEKLKLRNCVVFILAIISTFSTTGYILLMAALFFKFIQTNQKQSIFKVMKLFLIPLTLIVTINVLTYLLEEKLGTSSGSTRIDDFVAGFKAWKNNPIFGNGYGNYEVIVRYMSSFRRGNQGFSNSIMQILAYGGIYLTLIYVIPMVRGMIRFVKRAEWEKVVFYGLCMYMFIFTIVPFQMLTIFLFATMLNNKTAKI